MATDRTPSAANGHTERQRAALADLATSAAFAKASIEQRDADIRTARKLGLSLREIARAAHLGHTTVARVVGGAK